MEFDKRDISYNTDKLAFSYRVAGIVVRDGKVLLQKPLDDDGYAFPGGQVMFGETNAESLTREFKEELGADISVERLQWVAEILFEFNGRFIHQICMYYIVSLRGAVPEEKFVSIENPDIELYWIKFDELDDILLYPAQTKELLFGLSDKVEHFIYRE